MGYAPDPEVRVMLGRIFDQYEVLKFQVTNWEPRPCPPRQWETIERPWRR